jgi:hypothetical protein
VGQEGRERTAAGTNTPPLEARTERARPRAARAEGASGRSVERAREDSSGEGQGMLWEPPHSQVPKPCGCCHLPARTWQETLPPAGYVSPYSRTLASMLSLRSTFAGAAVAQRPGAAKASRASGAVCAQKQSWALEEPAASPH